MATIIYENKSLIFGGKLLNGNPSTPSGDITDYDGNIYTEVVIGTQTWLVGYLKTTHYNNGDPITNITDATTWRDTTGEAYCWYNNNISNKNPYGALYNWWAITDPRGVCPSGYRIPTQTDYNTLGTYLGGSGVAGKHMKSTDHTYWDSNNTGDNSSGFYAYGTGSRTLVGGVMVFDGLTNYNRLATSNQYDTDNMYFYLLYSQLDNLLSSFTDKNVGVSIRCIKS